MNKTLRDHQVLSLFNPGPCRRFLPRNLLPLPTGWGETALRVSAPRRKQIKRFSLVNSNARRESETFEWRNTRPELFFLGAKRRNENASLGLEFDNSQVLCPSQSLRGAELPARPPAEDSLAAFCQNVPSKVCQNSQIGHKTFYLPAAPGRGILASPLWEGGTGKSGILPNPV